MGDTRHRSPGMIENGVLFGLNEQLFLADGGHDILNFALRKRSVSKDSIRNFRSNLESRCAMTAACNVPYAHLIFPDKQSVLLGSFPFPDPACLGEIYLAAAPELATTILYPLDVLRAAANPVFQRTDTHLTDFGTLLVARSVLDRLFAKSHDAQIQAVLDGVDGTAEWVGDLGRRCTPPLSEQRPIFRGPNRAKWFHNDLGGGNNGLVDIWINPNSEYDKRLLIFGDSFGRELARFLSFFIKEVVFLRSPFFHKEMFDQIAPDLLVTDNVERYLSWCSPDDERPPFLMFPYLGAGSYTPEPDFVEALAAVLSFPREPYQRFMTKVRTQG